MHALRQSDLNALDLPALRCVSAEACTGVVGGGWLGEPVRIGGGWRLEQGGELMAWQGEFDRLDDRRTSERDVAHRACMAFFPTTDANAWLPWGIFDVLTL